MTGIYPRCTGLWYSRLVPIAGKNALLELNFHVLIAFEIVIWALSLFFGPHAYDRFTVPHDQRLSALELPRKLHPSSESCSADNAGGRFRPSCVYQLPSGASVVRSPDLAFF